MKRIVDRIDRMNRKAARIDKMNKVRAWTPLIYAPVYESSCHHSVLFLHLPAGEISERILSIL